MRSAPWKPPARHVVWSAAIELAVAGAYLSGYATIFWLEGRGAIGVYAAVTVERTAYWPIQQYRLSSLPGGQSVQEFRMWCFDSGQDSVRE
jgi:hypothetical protein